VVPCIILEEAVHGSRTARFIDPTVTQGATSSRLACCDESLARFSESGVAVVLENVADVATAEGDYPTARVFLEESLIMRTEVNARDARDMQSPRYIKTFERALTAARSSLEEAALPVPGQRGGR
jgi:hypothetical protein